MNDGQRPLPAGFEIANDNRANFPVEGLVAYADQWVAWTGDSTSIVTSGKDWEEVERKLKELGVDASQVIFEFIPALS